MVYNYAGKEDLGKGYWDPKRKLGETTHFSEIIKLQFRKKYAIHCFVLWYRFFKLLYIALLSLKTARLHPIFFLDSSCSY